MASARLLRTISRFSGFFFVGIVSFDCRRMSAAGGDWPQAAEKRHYRTELIGNAAPETSLWNEVQKRRISGAFRPFGGKNAKIEPCSSPEKTRGATSSHPLKSSAIRSQKRCCGRGSQMGDSSVVFDQKPGTMLQSPDVSIARFASSWQEVPA